MADLEKTVSVLFKGVDQISGSLSTISGSLRTFGGKLEDAVDPLASLALGVEKVDTLLAALAVGGLVYAFDKSSELTTAMTELDKVLGDNAEGMKAAEENASDLSEQYGVSVVDIVASTADFVQAGFSVEESMKLVKDAMDLAIAGNIDAGEAGEYLVKILKGFKAPAEDAAKVVDILNEVSNEYATDVKELATGMSKLSPIAATMGLSFEETASLLVPVIEVFGSGSEAADALKVGLLKISDNSQPVIDALTAIGVAQKDFNGELRPTKAILADIQAKFTTLTAEQKLFYTAQLVGLEQAPRMIEVFNGGAKAAKVLGTALKSAGSSAEEVAKQLATPEKQIAILRVSLVNLAAAIGEKYEKSAVKVIAASKDIVSALQTALGEGAFSAILEEIDSFLGEFADYLKDVAKAAPEAFEDIDYSVFLESLKDLGKSIGDLFKAAFGNIDLRKPEDLAKVIQKIVDAATKLAEFSTGIAKSLKPFVEKLSEWAKSALEADTATTKLAGKMAGFGQGIDGLVKALKLVGPAMSIFSGALIVDAIATLGKIAVAMTPIGVAAAALTTAVLLLAAGAKKMTKDFGEGTAQFDELGNIIDVFPDKAEPVIEAIGEIGSGVKELPEVTKFTINGETGEATKKINSLNTSILSFPEDFEVEAKFEYDETTLGAIMTKLNDIPEEHSILYSASMDEASKSILSGVKEIPELKKLQIAAELKNAEYVQSFMSEISNPDTKDISIDLNKPSVAKFTSDMKEVVNPDGTKTWVNVGVDSASLQRTQDALKEIPTEKMLEIKLQGEIDTQLTSIKTNAETVQKAMEWTAKVDIAGIEGDTKRMEASFASVSSEISDLTKLTADLYSQNWDDMGLAQYMDTREAARETLKMTKEAHAKNMQLIEAQTKYNEAKVEKLKHNDALVKIDSTGLEPALEMIMWQILQKVQLRANEDHASLLLGIN